MKGKESLHFAFMAFSEHGKHSAENGIVNSLASVWEETSWALYQIWGNFSHLLSQELLQGEEEAKAMLQVPKELSSSWAEFTKDPQVIVENRAKIDALIQILQKN